MAHSPSAATATLVDVGVFAVTITELEAGPTTEIVVSGLPPVGRIKLVRCSRSAGAGTAIRPIIGTATGPTAAANTLYWRAGDPAVAAERPLGADALVEMPGAGQGEPYYSATGTLYLRPVTVGVAVDNTVLWEVLVAANWE